MAVLVVMVAVLAAVLYAAWVFAYLVSWLTGNKPHPHEGHHLTRRLLGETEPGLGLPADPG